MKCLPDKLDSNKQTHRCAESHLGGVRDLNPNDGLTALCAEEIVKHLDGYRYE